NTQHPEKEPQQPQINHLLQKYKPKPQQNHYHIQNLNYQLLKPTHNYHQLSANLNLLQQPNKNQSQTNPKY
ncbi:hypothetical protein, partial [Staphylococcus epidermidis]|uniref:hypothetical protein n=1 Tax=Staphylococcus epidermidis TaxID=1282 RepID=UPI001C92FBEA